MVSYALLVKKGQISVQVDSGSLPVSAVRTSYVRVRALLSGWTPDREANPTVVQYTTSMSVDQEIYPRGPRLQTLLGKQHCSFGKVFWSQAGSSFKIYSTKLSGVLILISTASMPSKVTKCCGLDPSLPLDVSNA